MTKIYHVLMKQSLAIGISEIGIAIKELASLFENQKRAFWALGTLLPTTVILSLLIQVLFYA
jgi:hypothetical protein